MTLLLWIGVFALSLSVLVGAAHLFTGAAERLGRAAGMSAFATGVVIVSIGTSLPELVASSVAIQKGASEIVPGNVLGSSLSNLFLVLGAATLFAPKSIKLGEHYVAIDLNFLLGTAFFATLMLYDGTVSLPEGLLALAAYVVYVFYLLREGKEADTGSARPRLRPLDILLLLVSGGAIFLGGNYTVMAMEKLAALWGVSKAIVSVTVLSVGTTLPEVVTSAAAARRGKGDLAIGNILGSCIFNGLAILGIGSLFGPLAVPSTVLALPLPVYVGAVLFFYLLALDKKISRWEGILFLLLYALFLGKVCRLF